MTKDLQNKLDKSLYVSDFEITDLILNDQVICERPDVGALNALARAGKHASIRVVTHHTESCPLKALLKK